MMQIQRMGNLHTKKRAIKIAVFERYSASKKGNVVVFTKL
jgi:hypothetical protein